jgi:hypothetical protein
MSSPLAIAAVTATLCDLLNNRLIDNDLSPVGSFSVTALPPDRIETGSNEANRLNLFLYQVTANAGWRNERLPSHSQRDVGTRLTNPPLALDLHYMLTAYGSAAFAAEILLGYGMEVLHDARVLTRAEIRKALSPANPISVNVMPADPQGRTAIDLADQIEQVKITPHYLSGDELSRMWTAMQARYRPTMAYQVSTILIQGARPVRSPLPALARGEADRGNAAQASLGAPAPSRPTLLALRIVPATAGEVRTSAELGDTIELSGALLDGATVMAELRHQGLRIEKEFPVEAGASAELVRIKLPRTAEADLPAGIYGVRLRITPAGKPPHDTNEQAFVLAPRLFSSTVAPGAGGVPQLTVKFFPQVWPEQTAEVFVGGEPLGPGRVAARTGELKLSLAPARRGEDDVPVTLRMGGADSEVVRNHGAVPPEFDPAQKVSVP